MDLELAEHPKCRKERAHKGIHRAGRAPKARAPLFGKQPKAVPIILKGEAANMAIPLIPDQTHS